MNKKTSIMSLSIEPEMQELLKKHAEKKEISVSKLIRDLVNKHIANNTDDTVVPVILKIPVALKGNAEELQKWLAVKVTAIVKALS